MILRRLFGTAGHRNTKFVDLTRISVIYLEIDDMINRIAVAGTITNIIHSNHIRTEYDVEFFMDSLSSMPTNPIQSLVFWGSSITNNITKKMIKAIEATGFPKLELLNIGMVNTQYDDIMSIMNSVTEKKCPIQILSIDSNEFIGDKGINEISKILENGNWNKTLSQLCIDDINVSSIGLKSMIELFKKKEFENLFVFDLNENKVDDNGVKMICELLKLNSLPNLQTLVNPIHNEGVKLLCDVFDKNYSPQLYQLNAHFPDVDRSYFDKLYKSFCKGHKVQEIELFDSDILTRNTSEFQGL